MRIKLIETMNDQETEIKEASENISNFYSKSEKIFPTSFNFEELPDAPSRPGNQIITIITQSTSSSI